MPPASAPVPPAVPPDVLRASLGQVLFRTARLFNELAVQRVQQEREPRLRLAHTTLFPHLNTKGVRPTAIAKQLGVSKQAVGPLLNDLVEWGMIERFADPHDGRAVLVRLTPLGGAAILDGLRVLRSVEAQLREELGEAKVEALHTGLTAAMDVLDRARAEVG
ncbi:MarR family transcriptional regulator [Deltaproteobacteria bacterium]|nr:MarR family transcriptional regulator [Deltaproteobacteria bacterium]